MTFSTAPAASRTSKIDGDRTRSVVLGREGLGVPLLLHAFSLKFPLQTSVPCCTRELRRSRTSLSVQCVRPADCFQSYRAFADDIVRGSCCFKDIPNRRRLDTVCSPGLGMSGCVAAAASRAFLLKLSLRTSVVCCTTKSRRSRTSLSVQRARPEFPFLSCDIEVAAEEMTI